MTPAPIDVGPVVSELRLAGVMLAEWEANAPGRRTVFAGYDALEAIDRAGRRLLEQRDRLAAVLRAQERERAGDVAELLQMVSRARADETAVFRVPAVVSDESIGRPEDIGRACREGSCGHDHAGDAVGSEVVGPYPPRTAPGGWPVGAAPGRAVR